VLLLIKTRADSFAALQGTIQALHPHENPEIIGIDIAAGASAYLDWIRSSVK